MICLRCGYCCKNNMVIIVDDPEKGIVEGNLILHEGNGIPCKHLLGDSPGKYSCALYNYSWYKDTPCYRYSQIRVGKVENICRIGKYILNR